MSLSPNQVSYRSVFDDWYSRAAIRSKPRRVLAKDLSSGLVCFPPELVPVSQHRLLADRGEGLVRELLTRHLLAYLSFTDHLEHGVVNRTVQRIAVGEAGFGLPQEMRLDAYKIYCDEAYHSLFCADLAQQIHTAAGIPQSANGKHAALEGMRRQCDGLTPEMRDLAETFFVIVSETLISATFTKIPADGRVLPAVRQAIADHAEDEGRHHAYFAKLCELVWPQLTPREKETIGPLLPFFITIFLGPNYPAVRAYLSQYLSPEEAEQVIVESYPPQKVSANITGAARATMRLFGRCGVLEHAETAEAFRRSGLLV